jgi:hypothetical protein
VLDYTAVMKPNDEYPFFLPSLGMKKKIAKYFEDCEIVKKNAQDGEYGKGLNYKMEQFMKLCTDYETCK